MYHQQSQPTQTVAHVDEFHRRFFDRSSIAWHNDIAKCRYVQTHLRRIWPRICATYSAIPIHLTNRPEALRSPKCMPDKVRLIPLLDCRQSSVRSGQLLDQLRQILDCYRGRKESSVVLVSNVSEICRHVRSGELVRLRLELSKDIRIWEAFTCNAHASRHWGLSSR